ncbi:MAG: hypothetical protein WCW30_04680 [Candidatus Gracilibacteria bacterium]|jgi:hypothetical protein
MSLHIKDNFDSVSDPAPFRRNCDLFFSLEEMQATLGDRMQEVRCPNGGVFWVVAYRENFPIVILRNPETEIFYATHESSKSLIEELMEEFASRRELMEEGRQRREELFLFKKGLEKEEREILRQQRIEREILERQKATIEIAREEAYRAEWNSLL